MKEETRQLARDRLGAYILALNPDYSYVRFQQEFFCPALEAVAHHRLQALMLLVPFRHSKSETGSINFPAWLFGKWPKRKNMLLSYSDKFAKRFGRKVLQHMQQPAHDEIFPDCKISPTAHSGSYFTTTEGGEFYSAGFSGTITGQGVDGVLIIDDPIKNAEEARSKPQLESRLEDYRSAANTRLEGGSKVLICNRWCRGDFVDRLLDEEGEAKQGGKWVVMAIPAEAEENDPLGREPGEFLWTERLGAKWYEDHKSRRRLWHSMCQQRPEAEKGHFFKREWLCFYPRAIRPGRFPAYMLTDPGGKDAGSDRNAIGVFVTTPEKRILLVDAVIARLDPGERAKECIRLIKKWRPRRWLYEEYALMSDTWYLNQEMAKAGIHMKAIPVGRKGPRHVLSKESRIEGLVPLFREGRIWFPDVVGGDNGNPPPISFATMIDDNDVERDIVDYLVEDEYVKYSGEDSVPHEDGLDMMSRLLEPELGLTYPSASASEVARATEYRSPSMPAGRSWMSVY